MKPRIANADTILALCFKHGQIGRRYCERCDGYTTHVGNECASCYEDQRERRTKESTDQ